MNKTYFRADRVSPQIQRELADLLRTELKDPRISNHITLTDVEVTRDLSYARVFYTLLEGEQIETQKTLVRSAGFLRSALAQRIKLFKMPELRFEYDHSIEHGERLTKLIQQANSSSTDDPKPHQ